MIKFFIFVLFPFSLFSSSFSYKVMNTNDRHWISDCPHVRLNNNGHLDGEYVVSDKDNCFLRYAGGDRYSCSADLYSCPANQHPVGSSSYMHCACIDPLIDDGKGGCKCPAPKEPIAIDQCPDHPEGGGQSGSDDPQIICADPCPAGTHRSRSGQCLNDCTVEYCDADAEQWKFRLPYDKVGTFDECQKCQGAIPNADSSDCSDCPYYEKLDGTCTDTPCTEEAPFYYPISETSERVFASDSSNSDYSCYTAGDNKDYNITNGGNSNDNNNNSGNNGSDNQNNENGGSDSNNSQGNNSSSNGGGSNSNNNQGSGGGSNSNGNNSNGSGNSGNGQDIDLSGLENKADNIKKSVDNVGSKVDNVGKKIDGVKKSVDGLGSKVDNVGKKIDDLNKNFKSDGSTGYFDGLTKTVDSLTKSFYTTKTNFDNIVNLYKNGFNTTMQSGSSQGFDFVVFEKTVHIDICSSTPAIRPIFAFFIQLTFLIASIRLFIWGIKS